MPETRSVLNEENDVEFFQGQHLSGYACSLRVLELLKKNGALQ